MIEIRPVSDLRNKFREIEETVTKSNEPVFLTKNGYGTMVIMSLENYSALTENIEQQLDEADRYAKASPLRLSHADVFDSVRGKLDERSAL